MKNRFASALVLISALTAFAFNPVSAASPAVAATAYRVSSIEKYGTPSIVPGDSLAKVRGYLGNPDQKLANDTWVYHDFNPSHRDAKRDACSIVIITFEQGRIAEIRGVNSAALQIIKTQVIARAQPARTIAATH